MKYLLALFGEERGWQDLGPDEMQAMLEPWSALERELIAANVYIAGEALQPSSTATTVKVTDGADRPTTDGPFAETKEQLGGFYMLECENLDEALGWAKKVPMQPGASIEVRPVMDFTQIGGERPSQAAAAAETA
jgi:hypothetical protein